MRNPAENFKNRAETAPGTGGAIDALFEPQVRQLGGVLVDDLRSLIETILPLFHPQPEARTKRRARQTSKQPILIDHQNTDLPSR